MQAVVQGVEHDAPICALAPSPPTPLPQRLRSGEGGSSCIAGDVRRRLGRGAEVW
jgi:hypothetical protein